MYFQKQHPPGGLTPKMELLQSNTNRVANQHQALCQLIENTYTVGRLKYNIELVNQTMERVQKLKQNSQKILNETQWHKNKMKNNLSQSKLEFEIKQLQNQLNKVKQEINKRKKQQNYQSKGSLAKTQNYFSQVKKKNDTQIESIRKNVQKYLDNAKKEVVKNHQNRVLNFVNSYLLQQSKPYCQDIEAQIGLLICQLQYENYNKNKNQYSKQVLEVQNRFKLQKEDKEKQLQYGKLQRKIVIKNLKQFYTQSKKRIIYDCHLLLKKVESAIQCIKANIKGKHKAPNIILKYQQRSRQLNNKILWIRHQIQGMKIKIKFSIQKIGILDAKIMVLGCNEKQGLQQFKQEDEEIQMNFLICQQKIQDFNKLRAQFIFQSN